MFKLLSVLIFSWVLTQCSSEPDSKNGNTAQNAETDSLAVLEFKASMVLGKYGCLGCHSVDGSVFRGPSFKGLYGSEVLLNNGEKKIADEAYIRKSISKPNEDIPKGFYKDLMPKLDIPEDEIQLILFYLKSLSEKQP